MFSDKRTSWLTAGLAVGLVAGMVLSCGPSKKALKIQTGETQLGLVGNESPEADSARPVKMMRDTLKVQDDTGRDIYLMKAVKDEDTGEMVATEILNAATVIARFRHVAERNGKVDLYFQVIIPGEMRDSKWQVRIQPTLYDKTDSIRLDEILVTGERYFKTQLRSFEQYERLIQSILTDTDLIARKREIEVFLERNIPEVYAWKLDTTYVSDEAYETMYQVTFQEVIDHYGLRISNLRKHMNDRRKRKAERMQRTLSEKYPTFMGAEAVRLDTVIRDEVHDDYIYNYVQTVNTKKDMRSVNVVLDGGIYQEGNKLYSIQRTQPYTFYISSTSSLYQPGEKYLRKIIERKASANTSFDIAFETAKTDIDESLGDNAWELRQLKNILAQLLQNQTFDLDSVVITAGASPEGSASLNHTLSSRRGQSVSAFTDSFCSAFLDSLEREAGYSIDEEGNMHSDFKRVNIPIRSKAIGEDWKTLDQLMVDDTTFTEKEKGQYAQAREIRDLDRREASLRGTAFYTHMKDSLYPRLRRVNFDFHMHRKGMVKDTVITTEPDTVYRNGLEALQNMDYKLAVKLLEPYKDYNTAVAFLGVDRNYAAYEILSREAETPSVDYLLAIAWSRMGDEQKAVQYYLRSCELNPSFVHRGNLDPEISVLIKTYNLNSFDDDLY